MLLLIIINACDSLNYGSTTTKNRYFHYLLQQFPVNKHVQKAQKTNRAKINLKNNLTFCKHKINQLTPKITLANKHETKQNNASFLSFLLSSANELEEDKRQGIEIVLATERANFRNIHTIAFSN